MKIVIFGSTGMLGRYITKYLQFHTDWEVVPLTRGNIDITNFAEYAYIDDFISGADVVINCAGIIRSRLDNMDASQVFMGNAVFPQYIADRCYAENIACYHFSTDCVFTGKTGGHNELSPVDAVDTYGYSKYLGESKNASVIRTSIIGEEMSNKYSLLEWVRSQRNNVVQGYANHYWSGITCLEAAKLLESLIYDDVTWFGPQHVFSNAISKYKLVELISDVFDLNVTVNPIETQFCDRRLTTLNHTDDHFVITRTLREQLVELKSFHGILKDG
jgi:dTDP-4-dehydrorhamnose reductase